MIGLQFLAGQRLWFLAAVGGLLVLYVFVALSRRSTAIRFSDLSLLERLNIGQGRWRRHVVAALTFAALSLFVVALAQPQSVTKVSAERATIMLAFDVSISMEATDVKPTRFAAAQAAAKRFVGTIPTTMQLGLVSFSKTTKVNVSPTTDRTAVVRAIDALTLREGTAIGDAIDASVDAITELPPDDQGHQAPGVVVLMTDGANTWGAEPAEAAPRAKEKGIPVYTIAYGTPNGTIQYDTDGDGRPEIHPVEVEKGPLREVAKVTGGEAFEAQSESDLTKVYENLGSSIGSQDQLTEVSWWFVGVGLLVLVLSTTLSMWWFQRMG